MKMFVREIGVPGELTVDGSKDQNIPGTEFIKNCRRNYISLKITEPDIPKQNPPEGLIRDVHRKCF